MIARERRRGAAWTAAAGIALLPTIPLHATVTVDAAHPGRALRAAQALGAGLDGHDHGDTARIYTPANVRAMASAGLGPVSYRLRTELAVEAWHPTQAGTWSDPARKAGYFTPSAQPSTSLATYGYRLPRRGDTIDQANDDGYSRLDDGRRSTFWKSNPYLDRHFTGTEQPQWVLVDLRRPQPVDAVRLDWATPWATRVSVQWWDGPSAILLAGHPPGRWRTFPDARGVAGHAGTQLVRLAPRPRSVRFVRVVLDRSSHVAPPGSRDVRDRLGYAIREIGLGTMRGGRLLDLVRHARAHQTVTMASSTDPWHTAADRDPHTEQPGLATVLRSGLTHGQPLLVPVPILYGTPEAAVAELRMMRATHVPIGGVELGEEPDGQLASPEDYAALYVQFARAIHRYDRTLRLGGPGLQTEVPDWQAWPDRRGDRSWTHRFVAALRARGAMSELRFFSFEWYPFDNVCANADQNLLEAPATLAAVLARQRAHGVPASVPWVVTEYGYSAFAGRAEVDRQGALFDAEVAAQLLSADAQQAFFYGSEPDELIREATRCSTFGNLTLFVSDSARKILQPTAALWSMRMVTQDWLQPGGGPHEILPVDVTSGGAASRLVTAYAVRRPDGHTSILLLNKDPRRTALARVTGVPEASAKVTTLSSASYVWHPDGDHGVARPDTPPIRTTLTSIPPEGVALPPTSLTVLTT